MTKAELETRVEELENEVDELQSELYSLEEAYNMLEEETAKVYDELEEYGYNCIKDIDNFKFKLREYEMMTDELEEFIEEYLRWYNE